MWCIYSSFHAPSTCLQKTNCTLAFLNCFRIFYTFHTLGEDKILPKRRLSFDYFCYQIMTWASFTKLTTKLSWRLTQCLKGRIRKYYCLEKLHLQCFRTRVHDRQCVRAIMSLEKKIVKLEDSLLVCGKCWGELSRCCCCCDVVVVSHIVKQFVDWWTAPVIQSAWFQA